MHKAPKKITVRSEELFKLFENHTILGGHSCWDDYANSPMFDSIWQVLKAKVLSPAVAIFECTPDVHKVLVHHPDFTHALKYNHPLAHALWRADYLEGNNLFSIRAPGDALSRHVMSVLDVERYGETTFIYPENLK